MILVNKLKSRPRLAAGLALTVIILVTLATYSSTIYSGLVEFDDQFQVTQNFDIKRLDAHSLKKMFSSFYLGMYQPLASLTFALEYKFWHSSPLFLHLDNLLLHLVNIWLVYWLSCRLFNKRSVALISAALFAVHPLQVESVAWVSARSNLLSGLFLLAALLAYTFYLKKFRPAAYGLSLLLFIAALLSKASAVVLPVILLLLDWYQRRPLSKKMWLEKLPFFALSLVFGLIVIKSRGINALVSPINYAWTQKLLFIPYDLLFYLKKLLLPINLSAYYGLPKLTNGWLPPLYYLEALLAVALLVIIWHYRRHRTLLWLTGFYCLLLAPTLPLKIFSPTIAADRYAYLANISYFWFCGLLLAWLAAKFKNLKTWLLLGLLVFITLMAGLAKIRTWAWYDNYSLWRDVLQQNPEQSSVYNSMANAESRDGNLAQAMTYYGKALEVDPKDAFTYNNIGSAIVKNGGDNLQALNYYNQAIKLNPNEPLFYYNRGNIWFRLKEYKAALIDYQLAVTLTPAQHEYYYVFLGSLARTQYELNMFQESIATYDQAIDIYGLNEAYFFRGLAKTKLGQIGSGCQDLKEADKLGYKDAKTELTKNCQ